MKTETTSTSTTEEQRKLANLRVLQRLDDSIDDIVGSATYVVVYEFKQQHREGSPDGTATSSNNTAKTSGEWQKCDIEGSLFIIRAREMKYKLIILNRNSTRNMVVPIVKLQISSEKPFLIFRSSNKNTIHGIWFHRDEERSSTYDLMSRILNIAQEVEYQKNNERNIKDKGNAAAANVVSANGLAEGFAASLLLSPLESNNVSSQKQQCSSTSADITGSSQSPMILDKKNLQLALLSLIQDDRFIDLIHTQYVKIAHARGGNTNNKK